MMDRAVVGFGDPSMFVTALARALGLRATARSSGSRSAIPQPCRLTGERPRSTSLSGTVLPPLGLLSGQHVRRHARHRSEPGDRVVFYSDGVIERR